MNQNNSLFRRVYNNVKERRERILSGKINCIPWGLPRFEKHLPGIEKGRYYLLTANSKVGKSQITDFLFLYNILLNIIEGRIKNKVKIFYFTLEMSKEEKMLSAFSHIIYVKEGIRIDTKDLKSTRKDKALPEEVLNVIEKYQEYFNKLEEIVEFIDDIRHPTGINSVLIKYANANGTTHYRDMVIDGEKHKVFDYYEPNDPEEYVMIIIDHISLISTEKSNGIQQNLQESIVTLSSRYLISLRNRYNYIPVVIQQQAAAQESVENKKANRLKPSLDGLGDSKLTARDANVILGLFSPYRHEIPTYGGYDISFFKDNIRFLEIIGGREGGGGVVTPLYFDGAVNYFKELPRADDTYAVQEVKSFIEKIRNV